MRQRNEHHATQPSVSGGERDVAHEGGGAPPGVLRSRWAFGLALAVLVVLGWVLRLPREGLPPGLYRDEAYYALDALATWVEGPRAWYPGNNGREPLFVWLLTPLVALLGPSPAAIRLPAAFGGALAVAATGALGRALWGRRAGLVAAALLAVAPWPVWLGRLGFRAALLPALLAMAGAAAAVGWRLRAAGRPGARRWLLGSGVLAGLGHATYTAALAAPLAAGLWVAGCVIARPRSLARRQAWGDVLAWALPWLGLALAMAAAATATGGAPWARAAQVAVATGAGGGEGGGVPWRALLRAAADTVGLVFVHGDDIARHNVPGRPFVAPWMAVLWCMGLLRLLWAAVRARRHSPRARQERAVAVALLAWLAALALPTALAEDAPHFLRAVGLLPALAVVAGVGASVLLGAARRWGARGTAVAWVVVGLALALELAASLGYARRLRAGRVVDPWAVGALAPGAAQGASPVDGVAQEDGAAAVLAWRRLYFAFEGGAAEVARQAAREAGQGWDGGWTAPWGGRGRAAAGARLAAGEVAGVLREPRPPPAGEREALWLDRRLRDGWASLALLAPIERLRLVDPYDPVLEGGRGVAFLVPAGIDPERMWAAVPPTSTLRLTGMPAERGDRAAAAREIALRVEGGAAGSTGADTVGAGEGEAMGPAEEPLADFEGGPQLVGLRWGSGVDGARGLESLWLRGDAAPLVSGDPWLMLRAVDAQGRVSRELWRGPLGRGVLPPSAWPVGQRVVLPLPVGPAGGLAPAVGALELVLRAGEQGPALVPRVGGEDGADGRPRVAVERGGDGELGVRLPWPRDPERPPLAP